MRSRIGCGDGVPFGIFIMFIKGLSGLDLSLTCRKGAFAEDPSEEKSGPNCQGTS
jgi:hypothetical protein